MHGPLFTKRDNGVLVKVASVTSGFAQLQIMKQLPSSWSMPVADYDSKFVLDYLPVDIPGTVMPPDEKYREPINASYWDEEKAALASVPANDVDGDRSETGDGVRIGGDRAPWETATV